MTTIWTSPRYPGDGVREVCLQLGRELGMIRIQQYREGSFRVGSFLPGVCVMFPGDTPKTEPELSSWHTDKAHADAIFDEYLKTAHGRGWVDVH
jgi:hypothetical protein